MCVTILLCKDKKLLHFKVSKLGQILCIDKPGFLRSSHMMIIIHIAILICIDMIY